MFKYEITYINGEMPDDEIIVEVPSYIEPHNVERYLMDYIEEQTDERPDDIEYDEVLIHEGEEIEIFGETHVAVWVYEWAIPELEYGDGDLNDEDSAYIKAWEEQYHYCTPCYTHEGEWIIDEFAYEEIDKKWGKLALVWAIAK